MDLELKGRRALVTGSSSGIGEGIARLMAEEGARVVVHGRNAERAEKVAKAIGAAGIALGDLATDEGADATVAAAEKALGGNIEIVINNAGGGTRYADGSSSTNTPFLGVNIADWISTYQSNTLAALRMIERLVPKMKENRFGRIIQISSAVSVQPNYLGPDYSSAKAAMNNMTASLAGSLKGVGITVNTVSPGVIITPGMMRWGRQLAKDNGWGEPDDAELERLIATERLGLPAGRIGRVEDIGMMCCLLASPRTGYITGVNHRIDGGQIRSV